MFPRPGQPIVARVIAPFLDRLWSGPGWAAAPATATALGPEVWRRQRPETCRKLATLAVKTLAKSIHAIPAALIAQPLPAPTTLLAGALVERRTHDLLARHLSTVREESDRRAWTIARYLEVTGFGARALLDVLSAIESAPPESHQAGAAPMVSLAQAISRIRRMRRRHRSDQLRLVPSSAAGAHDDATLIERAVAAVLPRLPLSEAAARARLLDDGLDIDDQTLADLLAAAVSLRGQPPFRILELGGAVVAVRGGDMAVAASAYAIAARAVYNWGLTTITEITRQVSTATKAPVTADLVAKVLAATRGYQSVSDPGETAGERWFWFQGRPNRALDGATKIFSVADTVPLARLRRALFKGHLERALPPLAAVAALCLSLPGTEVRDGAVSVARRFDQSILLSESERALADVLGDRGPTAVRDLRALPALAGLPAGTLDRLIRTSPLLESLPGGRCCLVGAPLDGADEGSGGAPL